MTAEVWKIMAICVLGTAFSLVLRQKSAEFSFAVVVVTAIIVVTFVLKSIAEPIELIFEKLKDSGVKTEYFKICFFIKILLINKNYSESSSVSSVSELAKGSTLYNLQSCFRKASISR